MNSKCWKLHSDEVVDLIEEMKEALAIKVNYLSNCRVAWLLVGALLWSWLKNQSIRSYWSISARKYTRGNWRVKVCLKLKNNWCSTAGGATRWSEKRCSPRYRAMEYQSSTHQSQYGSTDLLTLLYFLWNGLIWD